RIEAALVRAIVARLHETGSIGRRECQIAMFTPPEVFALQLEIAVLGISVRRPFPDEVGDRDLRWPRKCEARIVAGEIGLHPGAVARCGLQIGEPGAPAAARADVAAEVHVRVAVADAVLVAIGAGESRAVADFAAELDEEIG